MLTLNELGGIGYAAPSFIRYRSPPRFRSAFTRGRPAFSRVQIRTSPNSPIKKDRTRRPFFIGELGGIRTRDPLIKSQMLYRLSYELN